MRLIDANAVIATLERYVNPMPGERGHGFLSGLASAIDEIEAAPTVDAVPVVRCKDCKYYDERNEDCHHPGIWFEYCSDFGLYMKPDDFCSCGERRNDENT